MIARYISKKNLRLFVQNDRRNLARYHGTVSIIKTLTPRQNGRHFADSIFKCILLNENVWITIKNSLKFVPEVPIYNIPALVQIMAWRRPGDKPLSETMLVSLPTHIYASLGLNELRHWRRSEMASSLQKTMLIHLFCENCCILIQVSLICVPMGPLDNKPPLVHIMAWCRTGDKPLSKPKMA